MKRARFLIPRLYDSVELKKWERAITKLKGMNEGDLVWTRKKKGHYYLGRLTDAELKPTYGKEYVRSDIGSARACDWHEVPDDDAVPAAVSRSTRGTIHLVEGGMGKSLVQSQYHFNRLAGRAIFPVGSFRESLFDVLGPYDLEDLVGLYLQVKENLLVIPSSCKHSTPRVEFWMKDRRSGEEVGVQVKSGSQTVDLADYNDESCRLFFFQQAGEPPCGEDTTERRIFITPKQLLEFSHENPRLLPTRIRSALEK